MFDEYFAKAQELRTAGTPFATAVVVRAERPTSGKPGDRAIVTVDGTMFGWIGGSCAQPTVIQEAAAALADGATRLIRLSPDPGSQPLPDGVSEVAMTCFSGGTLDIFIEPHHPTPQILIAGSLPVARSLAQLSQAMGYRVIAVDPTEDGSVPHADLVLHDLAEIPEVAGPLTFAVVATHGDFDEPALKAILESDAAYVGLVASRVRGETVMVHLRAEGMDDATLDRVRFPAGLDIQARRGDEIAVSILAEIIQVRRSMDDLAWKDDAPSSCCGSSTTTPEPAVEVAIDPICKMEVRVAGALHTFEHEGDTYYFCCPGCRARFAEAPQEFLAAG